MPVKQGAPTPAPPAVENPSVGPVTGTDRITTMTRRGWIVSITMLFIGLVVGGGGMEGYHRIHENNAADLFDRQFRCHDMATRYAREQSPDPDRNRQYVELEKAGYSRGFNSCVAYFQRTIYLPKEVGMQLWVTDLLSGEIFYSDMCTTLKDKDCGSEVSLSALKSEIAFDAAIKGERAQFGKTK